MIKNYIFPWIENIYRLSFVWFFYNYEITSETLLFSGIVNLIYALPSNTKSRPPLKSAKIEIFFFYIY